MSPLFTLPRHEGSVKGLFRFLLLCTLPYLAFGAPQDSVSYSADEVVFTRQESLIKLVGNSKISYQSMTLSADTIFYYTGKSTLLAVGTPVLVDKGDTVTANYIAYNLDTRMGKLLSGHLLSPGNVYYTGEQIVQSKEDSAIYIHNGTYTTCIDHDHPHSFFYSSQMRIEPNVEAVVKPFVLNIGDAPVAAIPFFVIPLEKSRRNGWLTPKWGVGLDGKGSVDDIGYFWAPNDYIDFLAAGRINNFDSFMIKGKTRYNLKGKLSGSIYADYLLNDFYLGNSTRWSLKFDHNQNLLPDGSLTLTGSGTIVSDKDYFKDTRVDEVDELLNQQFSSNLSITKRFLNVGGYASINWNRTTNTNNSTTTEDLPSGMLSLNRRGFFPAPLNSADRHFWHDLGWQYTLQADQQFSSRFDNTDSTKYTTLRGASHSVNVDMPTNISYFRVTPSFRVSQSIHDTYYSKESRDSIVVDTTWEDTIHKDSTFGMPSSTVYDTIANGDSLRYNPTYKNSIIQVHDTITDVDIAQAHNVWWNTGVSVSTDIFGNYKLDGKKIRGIRHTLTPSVDYTFVPENDLQYIMPSFGGVAVPPIIEKQRQILSFNIRNLVESKVVPKGAPGTPAKDKVVPLFTLNFTGSYDFEADSLKWQNLGINGQIPTPIVNFQYASRYTAYDRNNELIAPLPLTHGFSVSPRFPALTGNIWNGDFFSLEKVTYDGYMDNLYTTKPTWRITLNPTFSYAMNRTYSDEYFKVAETYNLSSGLQVNFSQRWSMRWGGTWSFTESEFINQHISLEADLECWEMKLDWYPTGVASGRVYFIVQLKKHRDIKWEQKS